VAAGIAGAPRRPGPTGNALDQAQIGPQLAVGTRRAGFGAAGSRCCAYPSSRRLGRRPGGAAHLCGRSKGNSSPESQALHAPSVHLVEPSGRRPSNFRCRLTWPGPNVQIGHRWRRGLAGNRPIQARRPSGVQFKRDAQPRQVGSPPSTNRPRLRQRAFRRDSDALRRCQLRPPSWGGQWARAQGLREAGVRRRQLPPC